MPPPVQVLERLLTRLISNAAKASLCPLWSVNLAKWYDLVATASAPYYAIDHGLYTIQGLASP
jgi:hypothetical protein